MTDTVVKARDVSKRYRIGRSASGNPEGVAAVLRSKLSRGRVEEFWALKDVSFDIERGRVIGIIGNNGAGKSTLLKVLSRITEPTTGMIEIRGRVSSLLEVGTGFHPELTGRENIFLNGVIMGMKKSEIRSKFAEIVEFAGVENFLDTPVKRYSSGMYMRLAFSVAAHLDPDVLIIDEVLAVGDAAFQKKCLGKLRDVATQGQRTVLFVSHNFRAVQALCEKTLHVDHGRIVAFGDTREVVSRYLETTSSAAAGSRQWEEDAPGNEDIRLKRLEVRSNHSASGVFSSSHELAIELTFSATRDVEDIRIGFELATHTGATVFSTWRTDSAHRPFRAHAGMNRWRCLVPSGFLNSGTYLVTPKIGYGMDQWIVEGAAAEVDFEVILDHGVSPYWTSLNAHRRPGVIAPILDWKSVSANEHALPQASEYSR